MVAPEPLKVNEQPNAKHHQAKRNGMNARDVQPQSSTDRLESSCRYIQGRSVLRQTAGDPVERSDGRKTGTDDPHLNRATGGRIC